MASTLTRIRSSRDGTDSRADDAQAGTGMIIIAIVAVITVGGGLLATLGAGPKVGVGELSSPPHLNLPADHARTDIAPIVVAEEPPDDIIAALTVPAGSTVTAHTAPSASSGLYDGSITLAVPVPAATSLAFYRYELVHDGWHIAEVVSGASGGSNLYATHDSVDGFTWEIEVAVDAKSGAITPAVDGGGTPSQTSSVGIRIIEKDDAD